MIKPLVKDDIVALATPPGIGALAVIRVSGKNLIPLYKKITNKKDTPIPRQASYSSIFDSKNKILDSCIIIYFKSPNSYTGEDVIEISSHGGEFVPNSILHMLYDKKVREAAPGEFSYRAFLNGKIDLIQAESISNLITSKTQINASVQINNLNGTLSKTIIEIKEKTINLLTVLEHELDFVEGEINFTKISTIKSNLNFLMNKIKTIKKSSFFGKTINTGYRAVLCGKPNAGKSSLFNRLTGENRAIITNLPGTTRDTIEMWLEINGLPVCLIDTAGIIKPSSKEESLGIKKTLEEVEKSDIVLVLDQKNPELFYKQQNFNKNKNNIIFILSKSDLCSHSVKSKNVISISVKKNKGIDNLCTELSTAIKRNTDYKYSKNPVVVSKRQRTLINSGYKLLLDAENLISNEFDIVLLVSNLKEFTIVLEEIVGNISNEDIFNSLFSSFCIGK